MNTKSSLRKYYRDLRRYISAKQKNDASIVVTTHFLHYLETQQKHAMNIAMYLAHDGEVDLQPLIEQLWINHHRVYVPVIDDVTDAMSFVLYTKNSGMHKNRYGIDEPVGESINIDELNIVLMPLVAFDKTGARLGMGKGYYDKVFAHDVSCQLIGVAYACQCAETLLPVETWDIPLNGILTEQALILFEEHHE